ncbi:MAG: glycosyltransferase, partial [Hyphomicrobiaceae bacterium]|nr:glycosyltransferase [Hyphomicrobiaceae bacterium]
VPSVWREPFGRTALEAHAGGCAVISSGSGGLAEVSGGHAVMLPEVTAAALGDAMSTLIDDGETRARLAKNGRAYVVASFGIEVVSQRLFAFCDSVGRDRESVSRQMRA